MPDITNGPADEADVTEAVKNSPLLKRLIEEVRLEHINGVFGYNRMHNRHNRSVRPYPLPQPQPEPDPPEKAQS